MRRISPHFSGTLEKTLSDAIVEAVQSRRFAELNVVTTTPRVSMGGDEVLTRLRLAEILQTSLDVEAILEYFDECLTDELATDGLHYIHPLSGTDIHIAHLAENQFRCKLVTPHEFIGDLIVSRTLPFMDYEKDIIKSLLSVLIYPLRNAMRYSEALSASLRDPLTGAGNRVALTSVLHHEIEMSRRYHQDLGLLMLDMDNFKNINDVFGHARGDEVLVSAVEVLNADVRCSDEVFRYGGEEFVVLLPRTVLAEVKLIAERLRASIEALTLEQDGIRIMTTTSIGIAMLQAGETPSRLLHRADQAMYQAKTRGRNQVVLATL